VKKKEMKRKYERAPTLHLAGCLPGLFGFRFRPHEMSKEYFQRILDQEIYQSNIQTSQSLQKDKGTYFNRIHTLKSSQHLEISSLYRLRKRLNALSEPVHEQIRNNYVRNKDIVMRNNLQKQCHSLSVLEKMIRRKVLSLGLDYRKVSIGGYDGGLFERMFKIQPSKYMSKAQFLTVMRNVFQFEMTMKTEQQLNHLFDTFDISERNELDWRAFLYYLALLIHAYEPVLTHLKMGYAIFSSLGTLEFQNCSERLQLSTIKDLIEVPIIFSSRTAIRSFIDDCWFELVQNDLEAMEVLFLTLSLSLSLYLSLSLSLSLSLTLTLPSLLLLID
jgi:hypothetical protein